MAATTSAAVHQRRAACLVIVLYPWSSRSSVPFAELPRLRYHLSRGRAADQLMRSAGEYFDIAAPP